MYYYKLLTLDRQLLGAVSSDDLCYYNEQYQRMQACNESEAQYVMFLCRFYRPRWFHAESLTMKGKVEPILCKIISEDEYMEIRNNQNSI